MWDLRAPEVGKQAADLTLLDEVGRQILLSSLAGPLLVLIFRSPWDETGQRLLRDYRDLTLSLRREGVALCGVAQAEPPALSYLRSERGLGFALLADPEGAALSSWGMSDSNGLFLLDRDLRVLQRAQGERAPAEAMLAFIRRGAFRRRRPTLLGRASHFLHSLQHALRPRRLVR